MIMILKCIDFRRNLLYLEHDEIQFYLSALKIAILFDIIQKYGCISIIVYDCRIMLWDSILISVKKTSNVFNIRSI